MSFRFAIVALAALLSTASARAEWRAAERIEPYRVSGDTGIALYRSIGDNGPRIGATRVIALTDFTLTWKRDYQRTADGGCTLASATPNLTIVYRLPHATDRLPPATQALWASFITGIRAHERVHGEMIVEMVKKLQAASVGLTVANDPNCRKIRDALVAPFRKISDERVERSRAFDRDEMGEGGNVQQLVLRLVNRAR